MESTKVFLSLGSNIEDRLAYLKMATDAIRSSCGSIICYSSVYETEPWGFQANLAFLNQVIVIHTELSPKELMDQLLAIEKKLGRERGVSDTYQSRTVDIDILYYGSSIITSEKVSVPHARLHLRKFVLEPLCEIDADFVHPVFNCSNSQLLEKLLDNSIVRPYFLSGNNTSK